ncbi:MAG TPA: hypothetical protein HA302_01025 [Thermococcaceae archaeon]|jgi:hypothetical protein|uniref:hypothetical protein n=1 Tax=Thermococcus sp. 101 C5 TaxID=2654197 RepID=UPI00128D8704|nr:hypothetical protein [Thermococcus sp. 101 C5]MBC7108927.1 hypothetical protein [Methanomassiliicoccales archaeon]MDK2783987.1 hypothetical protein [Thermococcaceae archaeon]MPW39873.1 hypothetical protein [Thermococcus sp. 101 C5]HII66605.1 hypothetical protein [Thermococcaceae archaeon]
MEKTGGIILQLFILLFFSSVVVYAMINYSSFAPLLWLVFWLVLGYGINKIAFRDITNARDYSRKAYMIGYILLGIGMVFYFLKGGTSKSNAFSFVLAILLMYAVSPISIRLVGLENVNYITDLKDLTRLILAALISLAVGLAVSLLVFSVMR